MRELFQAPPRQRIDPKIPEHIPCYRILSEQGFFGPDDALHPMGEIVALWDVPNEDMEPLNKMAVDAMEKYLDSLEESSRIVAEKNGRFFASRPRTRDEMLANASEDARRVQTVGQKGVPIMGANKQDGKRIQKIGVEEVPDTGAQHQNARRAKIETISAA